MQKAYDSLKEQNQDLNKHYVTLHEASKQMTYTLERKDHDLNLAKAKSNALEQGWSVKKSNDTFIFSKKHENKREIFQEEYLERFILENMKTIPENI